MSATAPRITTDAIELRDWIAAQVIAALIIAPKQPGISRQDMDGMSRSAYDYAAAMIRARDDAETVTVDPFASR
ncbi:hypothetical protein [Arenimonas oryziterrae]|uniref:Uncharacterized protein n=1 Tax=Arenimonas oryziterrae DSM 21050 = YC6267 TaxID=1121015 RepID=A0A091BHS8_9GAMM|nr:hypothetical protein [Arenimonas oryziterrae]KFN43900.1 hypothetical protein N789_08100 [Arenimonas oryziterrae DSM 21050 = YC6267]